MQRRNIKLRLLCWGLIFVLVQFQSGCKKFVETDAPVTSLSRENVYNSDATAAAVLTGIYTSMSNGGSFASGIRNISLRCGLSADELTLFTTTQSYRSFYLNALTTDPNLTFWESFYGYLIKINTAIEGLSFSEKLTPVVQQQLIGEAKFMRAFIYFYLVNLYGDVPLVLTSDYRVTAALPRSPKNDVYLQIVSDLKDAQTKLTGEYVSANALSSTTERVRPNKWAANALLARVYLYMGDWNNAELQATSLINNSSLFTLPSLSNVFLKNSAETIWQLQPINSGWNTEDARVFILTGTPNTSRPVYLSPSQLNAFEVGDLRRTNGNWVKSITVGSNTYNYPYKYKSATSGASVTEYLMVLRLAEQYLIRAEARAKQNNLSGAIADIDVIRQRAGLPLISFTNPGISQSELLTAILHERQVELFTEWGHRWLDLKRTNNVDAIMTIVCPQKGGTWNSKWALYPLPLYDIQQNPNLTQNPGY